MIRKMIIDYKFNDKSYLYKTIVNFLLKNEKFFENFKSYDTIIPVPISKKRKRRKRIQSKLLDSKRNSKTYEPNFRNAESYIKLEILIGKAS